MCLVIWTFAISASAEVRGRGGLRKGAATLLAESAALPGGFEGAERSLELASFGLSWLIWAVGPMDGRGRQNLAVPRFARGELMLYMAVY